MERLTCCERNLKWAPSSGEKKWRAEEKPIRGRFSVWATVTRSDDEWCEGTNESHCSVSAQRRHCKPKLKLKFLVSWRRLANVLAVTVCLWQVSVWVVFSYTQQFALVVQICPWCVVGSLKQALAHRPRNHRAFECRELSLRSECTSERWEWGRTNAETALKEGR